MKKQRADTNEILRLQGKDRQYHLHPFTDPQALVKAPPFVMNSASGVYVEGQGIRLLDAMAGLGNVNIGYGREEMITVTQQAMQQLSFYHSFAAITNPWVAELSEKIATLAPKGMNTVFFANSGSEANETAIKLARMYWHRQGKKSKRLIISRDFAYHGSTTTVSGLNGMKAMHEPFGTRTAGNVAHVRAPFWYRFGGDLSPEAFAEKLAEELEDKIRSIGSDNIAAFIGEPVQATLGNIIPPETYWPLVEKICRRHDILIIADEVVTGFGRTGEWFGQQKFGFRADIMTLAKGLSSGYLPISATVLDETVVAVLEEYGAVLQHGFTTSGHPVAAAVALKNIQILEEEKLVDYVRDDIAPYLTKCLQSLNDLPIVGEIRACGLMVGIEICKNKAKRSQYPFEFGVDQHIAQTAASAGLIVRPAGNTIILCPPFIISHDHAELIVSKLRSAIEIVIGLLDKEGLIEGA